ncbi:MAG: chitobiase/beta-hexosaminidase C-terminal domain-containing protein [Paludibacter sp.]|nr:chitobiase/beta-hexosaminidase C-terminal domain-containing protein [Paludibacter sp.]
MKKITFLLLAFFMYVNMYAGSGTQTDPYTVAEVINAYGSNNIVPSGTYVYGYIVGGRYDDFDYNSNDYGISIADNSSETSLSNCLQVKLPTGLRADWHPKNNPSVLHKMVICSGSGDGYGGYIALENSVTISLYTPSSTTVSTPTISASGDEKTTDTYFNSAEITLATATEGATIYYTVDGSTPTTSSTQYSAPFTITETKTIKALAVKADMDNSVVAEKTITIATPATATTPYSEAFNNTLGDWVTYELAGTKPWYASSDGAVANGYQGGDVESWMISPKFTAVGDGLAFSFNYASKYTGNPILVKMSSNYIGFGDPSSANWTDLTSIAAPEVPDSYTVKSTGDIIAATTGTVYFALVYDNDAEPYSDWRITNASVTDYTIPTSPTITTVESSVPEMTAVTGSTTDTETIQVTGAALTADITAAVSGDNVAEFSVSPETLTNTSGAASGTITITYNPSTVGAHTATLTLSSTDATPVTFTLTGTASFDTPVATEASAVSNTGFTANWDALTGADSYELNVYTKAEESVVASDLFISEYGEGSGGNKKYVEIFNGTGTSVDLSSYVIKKAVNGGGWNATVYSFPESTNMANNSTFVLANNETDVPGADAYDGFCNWTGDDAIGLFKNDVLIDVFGNPDADPGNGWAVAGISNATIDHVLIRKSSVSSPNTDWSALAGTTSENSEWIVSDFTYNSTEQTTNLGSHTFDGVGVTYTPITNSPFTVTGETSKVLAELTANTTYYYTVIGKSGEISSEESNEISVATGPTTVVDIPAEPRIGVSNGNILLTTTSGQHLDIFNVMGQKIVSTITKDGLNTVPVNVTGVVFVKLGAQITKVML